ncbi:hypothetical protein D3C80_1142600 [compost metagenome]
MFECLGADQQRVLERAAVGKVHFDHALGGAHADVHFNHRAGGVGLAFVRVVIAGASLDLADTGQGSFYRMCVGGVNCQVEAHPGFAIALEALDVARAERGRLGPGIEFGGNLEVDIGESGVFIQAVHGLFRGLANGRQQKQAEQQWEGCKSHKSWRGAVRCSGQGHWQYCASFLVYLSSPHTDDKHTIHALCGARHSITLVCWRQRAALRQRRGR